MAWGAMVRELRRTLRRSQGNFALSTASSPAILPLCLIRCGPRCQNETIQTILCTPDDICQMLHLEPDERCLATPPSHCTPETCHGRRGGRLRLDALMHSALVPDTAQHTGCQGVCSQWLIGVKARHIPLSPSPSSQGGASSVRSQATPMYAWGPSRWRSRWLHRMAPHSPRP